MAIFGNPTFLSLVQDVPLGKQLRTARNRVFYRPAAVPTKKRGAPRKDGNAFVSCHARPCRPSLVEYRRAGTGTGDLLLTPSLTEPPRHRHIKKCREADLSLVRVRRLGAVNTKREPSLIWQGEGMPALSHIRSLYARRYGIEYSYCFDKQALLWSAPRLRTPEKCSASTQAVTRSYASVSAVHNEITLTRPLVAALRRPWKSRKREPTPAQVRRACAGIIAQLGTPAPRRTYLNGIGMQRSKRCYRLLSRCAGTEIWSGPAELRLHWTGRYS